MMWWIVFAVGAVASWWATDLTSADPLQSVLAPVAVIVFAVLLLLRLVLASAGQRNSGYADSGGGYSDAGGGYFGGGDSCGGDGGGGCD